MNDLLNPYASPQLPPAGNSIDERRTIVGSFVVDELTQRDAARGYRLKHVFWLASSLVALPIVMLTMIFVPQAVWNRGSVELQLMLSAAAFIVGSCATIGLHIALDWSIFWHNLRQLQRHPIAGAVGPWQVQINEQSISIATQRGQQTWPLAEARRMELNQRPIVIWLEPDLAIALPKHGDYLEDDYAAVRKTLRHRIGHIGGELVKWR